MRKTRPHGGVVAWLRAAKEDDLHIAAATLGEIQRGIELTRIQDRAKASELEAWADEIAASMDVVPADATIFRAWARLLHGKSETLMIDAMIAATAQVHGFIVVTRNVKDFRDFGVKIINPYKTA